MCMVRGQAEVGWEHMGSPERCSHRALSAGGNGPRVQVSPERTQVHEGRTVRLYCRAAGVPSATITWRKEGGSLPAQVRRSIRPGPQTGSRESKHLPSAPPTCTSYPISASSGSHHFQDGGLAPCLFGAQLGSNIGSVLASAFPPSAYPRRLALARRPQPLRQLTPLLCGRPGPSTQTSPPCSSQPSRPQMQASTSAWPPAPLAPRRPGSKWSSFQVQGLWGLEVWGAPARALLRPTHSSASTCRCQPPASQD